jgi:hypothetical protein
MAQIVYFVGFVWRIAGQVGQLSELERRILPEGVDVVDAILSVAGAIILSN